MFIFLFIFLSATGFQQINAEKISEIDSAIIWQSQKFRTILETAVKEHKDSIDIKKISEIAFSSMLKSLDPYSDYLTTETYTGFKNSYNLTMKTVGISLTPINDTLVVFLVTEDSPADKAGIQPGDKLIYIDGQNAIKMTLQTANLKLANQDSSFKSLNIVLKRSGTSGLMEFSLYPVELVIKSLSAYFILPETDIGYIKSTRFAKAADSNVRQALKALIKAGAKKIVFDLRGHNGGQVDKTCEIVDEFISGYKTITYLQGKNNSYYQKYISEDGHVAEKMPLVILIDGETMSAAEILAGAIQDLDRGLIIGEISYGKGMAQKSWEFKDGSGFRLTIGDYYTATGRNIQKNKTSDNKTLDPSIKLTIGEEQARELERKINEIGLGSETPVFYTPKGRVVLGAGGIFPDFFVKNDTTTILTQVIKQKNIAVEMAVQYTDANRQSLIANYSNDYKKFGRDFIVTDDMLKWMELVSRTKNIWNETMFQTDKEYLRNYVKSLIAYLLWGNEGFYYIGVSNDKLISKAIEIMPEAIEIISK